MLLFIEHIFFAALRTALPGSICILAVLAARLALRRMPARFSYLLWGVVVFRLICPVPPAAPFGLLPSSFPGSQGGQTGLGGMDPGTANAPAAVNGGAVWMAPDTTAAGGGAGIPGGAAGILSSPAAGSAAAPCMGLRQWAAVVWLAAALLLLGWQLVSLARLSLRLRRARQRFPAGRAETRPQILRLPGLESSFLFGMPCPRIYLPAGLDPGQERMILLHEQAHLRRGDWLVRPLAWVLVCAYWFDPLVWLAYCLAMQDMERCCDEAALRQLGPGERQNYARTLLGMAAGRQIGPWAPAFGQGEIKGRIRHLLRCTSPARWALGLAAAGVAAVCAVLAFSPAGKPEPTANEIAGWVYQYEKDGFGGDFTISLEEDGSFQYYEGLFSSYIGMGSWELDGNILTLRDDDVMGYPFVNRFAVEDGGLVFREEGSTNFMYLKVADGERFLPVRRTEAEDAPGQPGQDNDGVDALTGPDGAPLTFWIKPDEPLQVLGEVAATVWLNAQLDGSVPDSMRLAGYAIQSVRVTEGAPPAGQSREDLPYQYLVQVSYDITTASEAYSSPGDGAAGLGSFAGLYRELGVKELEAGNYAIVSVGTGGGAAPFMTDPELEEAIRQTLLGMYADPDHPDAMMAESHTTLYWEEVGSDPRAVRVYLLVMIKGEIGLTDGAGGLMQPREEFGPVRLTLIWMGEQEGWQPMEIWMLRQPEGTEAWHHELEEMFPQRAVAALLADSSQTLDQRRERLRAACDAALFGGAAAQTGLPDTVYGVYLAPELDAMQSDIVLDDQYSQWTEQYCAYRIQDEETGETVASFAVPLDDVAYYEQGNVQIIAQTPKYLVVEVWLGPQHWTTVTYDKQEHQAAELPSLLFTDMNGKYLIGGSLTLDWLQSSCLRLYSLEGELLQSIEDECMFLHFDIVGDSIYYSKGTEEEETFIARMNETQQWDAPKSMQVWRYDVFSGEKELLYELECYAVESIDPHHVTYTIDRSGEKYTDQF